MSQAGQQTSVGVVITVAVVVVLVAVTAVYAFLQRRQAIVLPNFQVEVLDIIKKEGLEFKASRIGQMGYIEWSVTTNGQPAQLIAVLNTGIGNTRSAILGAGLRIVEESDPSTLGKGNSFTYHCVFQSLRSRGSVTLLVLSRAGSLSPETAIFYIGSGDLALP